MMMRTGLLIKTTSRMKIEEASGLRKMTMETTGTSMKRPLRVAPGAPRAIVAILMVTTIRGELEKGTRQSST